MILIVDMNSKRDSLGYPEYVLPIIRVVKEYYDCDVVHHLDLDLTCLDRYDSIILSGNPIMDDSFAHRADGFSWLKDTDRRVLGICAGMQAICLAFGGNRYKCAGFGMTDIICERDVPFMESRFRAYSCHSHSVTGFDDLDVVARSDRCIQAVMHRNKDICGLLFHPEVRNPDIILGWLSMSG